MQIQIASCSSQSDTGSCFQRDKGAVCVTEYAGCEIGERLDICRAVDAQDVTLLKTQHSIVTRLTEEHDDVVAFFSRN